MNSKPAGGVGFNRNKLVNILKEGNSEFNSGFEKFAYPPPIYDQEDIGWQILAKAVLLRGTDFGRQVNHIKEWN